MYVRLSVLALTLRQNATLLFRYTSMHVTSNMICSLSNKIEVKCIKGYTRFVAPKQKSALFQKHRNAAKCPQSHSSIFNLMLCMH